MLGASIVVTGVLQPSDTRVEAPPSPRPVVGEAGWFLLSAMFATAAPATDRYGVPSDREEARGGEAVGVLDVDRDGDHDAVIVNGTDWFYVLKNDGAVDGALRFVLQPVLDGPADDGLSHRAKGLGLHDYDNDGDLDLWLANQGRGGVVTYKRDPPVDKGLFRSAGYSSWTNEGGSFVPEARGLDAAGSKRTAVFDDLDGDGWTDAWLGVSSYYGIWYAGGDEPSQLIPGRRVHRFGRDQAAAAFDVPPSFFADEAGRSVKNFKASIARDLDGDGRAELIVGGIADLWANASFDLQDPAEVGYQGGWERGLFLFHNQSRPGAARLVEVGNDVVEGGAHGHEGQGHVHSILAVDVDRDGDLDLIVSGNKGRMSAGTLEHRAPIVRVLRNDSTPGTLRFADITEASGLGFLNGETTLPSPYPITATEDGVTMTLYPAMMAGVAADVDLDGDQDLVWVDRQTFSEDPESGVVYGLGAIVFLAEADGRFRYVPVEEHGLRGTARDVSYGDFDGDGRVDLLFVDASVGGQNVTEDNRLWLNRLGGGRHWLTLRVDEPDNRQGIGARVDVFASGRRVLHDEVRTDMNYRSKRDAWLHTGVDVATETEVAVRFRDGVSAAWTGVAVDQAWRVVRCRSASRAAGMVVERGAACAGAPRRWMPSGGGSLSQEPLPSGVWVARARGTLWVVDPRTSVTREDAP